MATEHVICNKEADIATIKADVSGIKSDMSEIKHAILGNGQPGLKTEVAKHGQVIAALLWVTGASVTAILSMVITLVVQWVGAR